MSQEIAISGLFFMKSQLPGVSTANYDDVEFKSYNTEGRKGVSVYKLYDTRDTNPNGPAAAIVRYDAGALTPRHLHPGYELVLVLRGELIDDRGRHGPGTLHVYPPGSDHELRSETGGDFLVVWEEPVRPFPLLNDRTTTVIATGVPRI